MNKLNLPFNSFIGAYYIDEKVCDELINFYNKNEKLHIEGIVGSDRRIDHKLKKCKEMFTSVEMLNKNCKNYLPNLEKCLDEYLKSYEFANEVYCFNIIEKLKIQHYKKNDCFFKYHFENSGTVATRKRHLVFMTYLNNIDEKDGGGTEFKYQNIKIPCSKGLTIIWPSQWTHTHRGIISKNKEKYIITGWYSHNE